MQKSIWQTRTFVWMILIAGIFCVEASKNHDRIGDSKIIGGRVTKNIPFLVSIQQSGAHMCGGSLLNMKTTLTACHCVADYVESKNDTNVMVPKLYDSIKKYSVLAGEWDLNLKSFRRQKRKIKSLHAHPDCVTINGIVQWDFGLITVVTPFKTTEFVKPVKLYSMEKKTFDDRIQMYQGKNRACWVMGWGKFQTTEDAAASSRFLKAVKMKIITDEICQYYLSQQSVDYLNYSFTNRAQMCAVGLKWDESDCTGDSGGPVYCKGFLLGTVSYGFECGRGDQPAVYTRLSDFLGWYKTLKDINLSARSGSSYLRPCGWAFIAILPFRVVKLILNRETKERTK